MTANLSASSAFNEFISERECTPSAPTSSSSTSVHTSITLFDSIILSKRNRGRLLPTARQLPGLSLTTSKNPFSSRFSTSAFSSITTPPDFLSDTSDHLWRSASATTSTSPNTRTDFGDPSRDYRQIVTRVPAKLEERFMREPRMVQGVPRVSERSKSAAQGGRKPVPAGLRERMNGLALNAPDIQPPLPSPSGWSSRGR
jgi:hypothetical protein